MTLGGCGSHLELEAPACHSPDKGLKCPTKMLRMWKIPEGKEELLNREVAPPSPT